MSFVLPRELNYITSCNIIIFWLPYTVGIDKASNTYNQSHRFCDTQPTTSLALFRIQLIIPPMISSRASAAFTPNFPSSDAKALSFDLIHSFKPFSSLGGGPLMPQHPHLVITLQQVPQRPFR